MAEAALRIGLVCDTTRVPRWQLRCLQELAEIPGVAFSVVLDTAGTPAANKTSRLYRWWLRRSSVAPALALEDASSVLSGVPRLSLSARRGGTMQEELRPYTCDLLLQLASKGLPRSLPAWPRLGVWRILHGDHPAHAYGIPGIGELLHAEPVTHAILLREGAPGEAATVLREGHFRTIMHSVDRTTEAVLMCSARWPAQACRAFLSGGAEAIAGRAMAPGVRVAPPTSARMLRLLWKQFINKQRRLRTTRSSQEEWNIGVLRQPIASLLEDKPSLNVRWLPAPGIGQYRSSPFGHLRNGQLAILYEKFQRRSGMGVIARLRPKPDNDLKRSRTLMEGDGHLTYPYIVEHEGAVYALPEQVSTGRVDLYRLHGEPAELTRSRTILNEALFSPTLFEHEGRWWLFGTRKPLADTLLYAYYADEFEGPFKPHLLNPIKVDIRSARPGGTPFHAGNDLWRPARDRSREHGCRIALNHVTELTPTRFSEETVKYLEPMFGRWSQGMRTLSAVEGITLVDGMRTFSQKATAKTGSTAGDRRRPRNTKRS